MTNIFQAVEGDKFEAQHANSDNHGAPEDSHNSNESEQSDTGHETDHAHDSHEEDHGTHDNPHEDGSSKHNEHDAVFNLVMHEDATHVAINDGSWFDPDTWASGEVPDDEARVVIQEGVSVQYDEVSETRLFTVRVDGELNFATDTDSKMIVDTMVVDPGGALIIGTADDPVLGHVTVDIVIANNGDIDVSWDPSLLSRGVISHGQVVMHGQEKTTHLKVSDDPMAGDTFLTLSEVPEGWQVGDTIVLTGTRYDGYKWDNDIRDVRHHEPEDEVLTITAIDGNIIHFDRPLEHNHDTPREDLKASVANYTRNVSIETENADTAEIHERGHVMFMHSDDVDVRYVEFFELGRTDKSETALNASEFDVISADSNVKGRYSFHLHRTGVDDVENPAVAEGNAVFGSPGWGYVHHDANAILHDNASYNTFGAGFVAETGNEIGVWSNNIAIYAQGVDWGSPKNINSLGNFDLGKSGSGFYFQGRMVEAFDNIAASTNSGFTYFHRGRTEDVETGLDGMIPFDASLFALPEALGNNPATGVDDAPILNFVGNETIASNYGFFVEKANTMQGSDVRTVLEDFTAWEVRIGAHIAYTSHYLLSGFDLIGKESTPFSEAIDGIQIGVNASDVTIVDAMVEGFATGVEILDTFTGSHADDVHLKQHVIINTTFSNVGSEYNDYNPAAVQFVDAADLVGGRFDISYLATNADGFLTYREGYPDPDARRVDVNAIKTDSIGEIALPAGLDEYDATRDEVVRILEEDGYFSANGKNYFILEDYYSDRVTGEIHKYGQLVEIDENVQLGSPHFQYSNAVYNGEIDLNSQAPIAENDVAVTAFETEITINLLANDSDPDGDVISVDGIVQPIYGQVFDNGDGTITYRPGFEFVGTETFKYWTTDSFGNFTPATVTVEVSALDTIPGDDTQHHSGTGSSDADNNTSGDDKPDTGNDVDDDHSDHGHDDDKPDETGSSDSENNTSGDDKPDIGDDVGGDHSDHGHDDKPDETGGSNTDGNASEDDKPGSDDTDDADHSHHDAEDKSTLTGTSGADELVGTSGDDSIDAGDGADLLQGNAGADTVLGGLGDDTIWAGQSDDSGDYVDCGDGADICGAGVGDDTVMGGKGADIIYGGSGNDLLKADGLEDTSEIDANQIWAGSGDDTITGADGADKLGGGLGHDNISGEGGDDYIYAGKSGNDTIDGGAGDDHVFCGTEDDYVKGGSGSDELYGGSGNDTVFGGAGDDAIYGGTGDDILNPGSGEDTLFFAADSGNDQVVGFEIGEDTLFLREAEQDFVDLASVQAASSEVSGGVLIDLGGDSSLILVGLSLNDLQNIDFVF